MLLQTGVDPYGLRFEKERLINDEIMRVVPTSNLLDIQALILDLTGNRVRTIDEQGKLLSVDRTHLTKPGAIYLGGRFKESGYPLALLLNAQ